MRQLENTRLHCIVLLAVAGMFAAVNWLAIGSFWGDPTRSLFEIYRASNGEIPYLDFTFPDPPLAISVLGLMLHYGGATFRVAQIAYDAVGLGCVFAVWVLARRFARPVPAFFVTQGASATTWCNDWCIRRTFSGASRAAMGSTLLRSPGNSRPVQ